MQAALSAFVETLKAKASPEFRAALIEQGTALDIATLTERSMDILQVRSVFPRSFSQNFELLGR